MKVKFFIWGSNSHHARNKKILYAGSNIQEAREEMFSAVKSFRAVRVEVLYRERLLQYLESLTSEAINWDAVLPALPDSYYLEGVK